MLAAYRGDTSVVFGDLALSEERQPTIIGQPEASNNTIILEIPLILFVFIQVSP